MARRIIGWIGALLFYGWVFLDVLDKAKSFYEAPETVSDFWRLVRRMFSEINAPALAFLIIGTGFLALATPEWWLPLYRSVSNAFKHAEEKGGVETPTLQPPKSRDQSRSISLMRLREIAEKECGWDFASYSDQLFGLIGGLRQAAIHHVRTGIALEGRKGCMNVREELKLYFPLQPIPAQHFIDFEILLPLWSNWEVSTSHSDARNEDRYRDLYVTDEASLREWLAGPAREYRTPQANAEVRSALLHMAFHSDLSGVAEAVAAFEKAAEDREIDVYGYNIWPGMGVVSSIGRLGLGYWHHAKLDVESFDLEGKRKPTDPDYEEFSQRWQRTIPDDTQDAYCKLRVNKERILEIWPVTKPGSPLLD